MSSQESSKREQSEYVSIYNAINKVQGVIEFDLNGIIISANDNFLSVVGYSISEVKDKHHRIFCESSFIESDEYIQFWNKLKQGQYHSGEYKRLNKEGKEVWISASYNPILDEDGKPYKVIKFATDITETKKLSQLKQMIDLAPVNTLLADKEGTLLYMNEASITTLKMLEEKKLLPMPVEKLTGCNIDMFHKFPAGPRKIFTDPAKLPHKAIIQLGEENLLLLVSPILDLSGNFIGPMVTWEVVTAKVKLITNLNSSSDLLINSSSSLNDIAEQMATSVEQMVAQAKTVGVASEEVSVGMQTVSSNMEEMSSSIQEITKSTVEASKMSTEVSQKAIETDQIIKTLGVSGQDIGDIIRLISNIAQQTNLLALNATIEAARAGDAGKGFAVVANEVKELAKQTAKASDDITKKIETIQSNTSDAVISINDINEGINQVNILNMTIATSIEEQSATTKEVARIMSESSMAMMSINSNILQLSDVAESTGEGANNTRNSAKDLDDISKNLTTYVKEIDIE